MHANINERITIIKDLEQIFKSALEAGDYKAAIQAKHMIGKMQGFFNSQKQSFSLRELSQEELEALIKEAEDIKMWSLPQETVNAIKAKSITLSKQEKSENKKRQSNFSNIKTNAKK